MPCYYPKQGWRARVVNPSGARSIVFDITKGFSDLPVVVPCGKCSGCLQEYGRAWAVRCMHEASMWAENCFVTLTVDPEHDGQQLGGTEYREVRVGELDKLAFPLFMKRLRRWEDGKRIRYFSCGEYGSVSRRPHFHALLFGHDFADKTQWAVRSSLAVWRSRSLESLWPYGNSEIGTATFESASYVARYVLKKMQADYKRKLEEVDMESGEVIERQREYVAMSRRPGVGMGWLYKYIDEVYPSDRVVVRGKLASPPRAYDKYAQEVKPLEFLEVQDKREAARKEEDETWERLRAREAVSLAQLNLHRGL